MKNKQASLHSSRCFLVLSITLASNEFGLVDSNKVVAYKVFSGSYKTENFLLNLDRFLSRYQKRLTDLQGIIIIDAGGSFSQIRLVVTVANILAYVGKFKITQFNRPISLLGLVKLLSKLKWQKQIRPKYGATAVNKILS